jgi:predicted dehydrogenase
MISRRDFVRGSLALGSLLILPKNLLAQGASPNEKPNIAFIGHGAIGRSDLDALLREANVVALCDVDETNLAAAREKVPHAETFQDFRAMLDKMGGKLDGVYAATPDHSHFIIALHCLKRKLPVMVQKPLTNSIAEARRLREAAAEARVPTQMANQGHGGGWIEMVEDILAAGILGPVREVLCIHTKAMGYTPDLQAYPAAQPVPPGLAWDLWVAHRPWTEYSRSFHPGNWRNWWRFGNGRLGDWGVHTMDVAWSVLKLGAPESVGAKSVGGRNLTTPAGSEVTWSFPARDGRPAVKLTWCDGKFAEQRQRPPQLEKNRRLADDNGAAFLIGDDNTLMHNSYGGSPRIIPEAKMQELAVSFPKKRLRNVNGGVLVDWLRCIRDGKQPSSHFGVSGPFTEMVLLGNLAIRTGKKFNWDGAAGKSGDPDVDQLLDCEARDGWRV